MRSPYGQYPEISEPPASEHRYNPSVQRGGARSRRRARAHLLPPWLRARDTGVHVVLVSQARARHPVHRAVRGDGAHGHRGRPGCRRHHPRDRLRGAVRARADGAHRISADRVGRPVPERHRVPQGRGAARLSAQPPGGCGRPLRLPARGHPGGAPVLHLPSHPREGAPLRHGGPRRHRDREGLPGPRCRQDRAVGARHPRVARSSGERRRDLPQPLRPALHLGVRVQQVLGRRDARRDGLGRPVPRLLGVPRRRPV